MKDPRWMALRLEVNSLQRRVDILEHSPSTHEDNVMTHEEADWITHYLAFEHEAEGDPKWSENFRLWLIGQLVEACESYWTWVGDNADKAERTRLRKLKAND